jgi:hypothetical protein
MVSTALLFSWLAICSLDAPGATQRPSVDEEAPSQPFTLPPAPPRFRGTGLLIGGGVLAVTAYSLQIAATHLSVTTRREVARGERDCGDEGCIGSTYLMLASGPSFILSGGLLAGGMHLAGRWAAHQDAASGRIRDPRWMMGVGYGLVAGGIAVWLGGHVGGLIHETEPALETGWLLGPTMGISGAMLAGFGTSYHIHRKHGRGTATVQVGPVVARDHSGFSLSGRF